MPLLALLLSVLSWSFAGEPAAPPAPQLLRLESTLTQKLQDRKRGELPPDQYRAFAAQFRAELDMTLAQIPDTPVNRGRHAMILARLDESGPEQAVAGLDRALAASPDDSALLNAKGTIQLQQGDYAGALASAEAVLKKNQERGEAPDPEAVAIRQFSKGRGTPRGVAPVPAPQAAPNAAAAAQRGNQGFTFTPRAAKVNIEVPAIADVESGGKADPRPIKGSLAWTQGKIEGAQQGFVRWIGRKTGLRPAEEEAALKSSMDGAILGTGIFGVAGAIGGAMYCAPGAATGGPYLSCILAGGAGGVIVGAPTGAALGGTYGVVKQRTTAQIEKLQGKEVDSE